MNKIENRTVVLNPQIVYTKDLIDHILTAVSPLINEKELQFETKYIDLKFTYVRLDRIRFQQIFVNILSNAVKFTKRGGKIRFEIERLKLEDGISYNRFSIEDTGIGISEEFLPHIFEPFAQEKSELTTGLVGTGLGMAIVKELLDLMGGSIKVESTQGVGTRVTVYLSIEHVEPGAEEAVQMQNKEQKDLSGEKILLVEDHPINAMITKKFLEQKQMDVCHAVNGEEAVDMFKLSGIHEYAAILMDVRMPVMNGLEATRIIRALEREDAKTVPIIAMTANAFEEDIRKGLDAGMNEYLSKPVDPNVLFHTLGRYAAKD
ncbi:MAG: response regulator [Clostridia bacterium]|nr:response regulator [Clostridia bacterium]